MINACHTCKWLRKKENFENNISTVHIIWCSFILNWIKVLDITFLSKCANIKFERQEYSRWSKSTTCSISTFHTVMTLYVFHLLHVVQNVFTVSSLVFVPNKFQSASWFADKMTRKAYHPSIGFHQQHTLPRIQVQDWPQQVLGIHHIEVKEGPQQVHILASSTNNLVQTYIYKSTVYL